MEPPSIIVCGLSMKGRAGDYIRNGVKRVENRNWAPKNKKFDWIAIVNNAQHPKFPKHITCLIKIGAVLSSKNTLRLLPRQANYIDDTPNNKCWIISHLVPFPTPIKVDGGGSLGLWNFTGKRQSALISVLEILKTEPNCFAYNNITAEMIACDIRTNKQKKKILIQKRTLLQNQTNNKE